MNMESKRKSKEDGGARPLTADIYVSLLADGEGGGPAGGPHPPGVIVPHRGERRVVLVVGRDYHILIM